MALPRRLVVTSMIISSQRVFLVNGISHEVNRQEVRSILDLVSVLLDLLVDGLDGWGVLDQPCWWDGVLAGHDWGSLDNWGGSLDQWGGSSLDVLGGESTLDQWSLGGQSAVEEAGVVEAVGVEWQTSVDQASVVWQTSVGQTGEGKSSEVGNGGHCCTVWFFG